MPDTAEEKTSPLVEARDFLEMSILAVLAVFAIVLPPSLWPGFCSVPAALRHPGKRENKNSEERWVDHVLSETGRPPREHVARIRLRMALEARMQFLDRNLLRRWKPVIRTHGLERIDQALEQGRGVILWVAPSSFTDLLFKWGFHRSGYPVNHLSRPEHGYSRSRLGMRYVNWIKTSVESRYLAQRLVIGKNRESNAVVKLRRLLLDNNIVSITVFYTEGQNGGFNLFSRTVEVSTGPLRLAQSTKSPVLPVFVSRTDKNEFELVVESAINSTTQIHKSQIHKSKDWSEELERFGRMLEKQVAKHPLQWRSSAYRFDGDEVKTRDTRQD